MDIKDIFNPEDIRKMKIPVLILAVIVLLLGIQVSGIGIKKYDKYEVLSTEKSSDLGDAEYLSDEEHIIKYSKDGISYSNRKGDVLWANVYDMKNPEVALQGQYIVVADKEGNDVALYNEDGLVQSYAIRYPIVEVQVAKQGVVAVLSSNDADNYIQMYDREGELLVEIKSSITDYGYPMSMALSEDARRLIISYFGMNGITTKSRVSIYDFDSKKGQDNHVIKTYQFDHMLVPKVSFLDKKTFVIFGDDRVLLYKMKKIPGDRAETEILFDTEINSLFYNQKFLGFVCKNPNTDGKGDYLLQIYNTEGTRLISMPTAANYHKIKFDGKRILFIGDYDFTIYTLTGKQIFHTSFEGGIRDVVPAAKKNQYYVMGESETNLIKLK